MEKYCPKCFKKYPQDAVRCPGDGSYLVSTTDRDLTGEVLDERYTILERIGRGGMGVVYRAEQQLIKRIVALKVLRRDIVQDESAVKRFLNEARAIASLDSRHTVTLHDFGVTKDGLLYYTMELLKGRPLTRIIRDESPVDHVRAAGLLLQACSSLEEAHEHNILHRDIKPDNLFVTVRKGREELKVLDFGIAKLVGDASMDTVTRTGMIIGTPQYLSPEQALGNTVVPASDLYSLAIVFYEMLAGKPPFIDDTPMKTMWAHIRDPVPPLRKRNPDVQVPRSIEAFLTRALEKEPGKRFASVPAFADALRKAVEDHDASPETVSLPPLSTTDQGLRVRTQVWDGKKAGGQRQGAGAEAEDARAEKVRGTRAMNLEALGQTQKPEEVERPAHPGDAQPDFHAAGTAREKPEAQPEGTAREKSDASAAKPKPRREPPEPAPGPATTPPAEPKAPSAAADGSAPHDDVDVGASGPDAISFASDPRPLTPAPFSGPIVLSRRRPMLWAGGATAVLVLIVGLFVWAPWADSSGEEHSNDGSGQAEAATSAPVTEGDEATAQDMSTKALAPDAVAGPDETGAAVEPIPAVDVRRTVEVADVSTLPRDISVSAPEDVRVEPPTDISGGRGDAVTPPKEDVAAPCVPSCEGKQCGDDGCGGFCGECTEHSGAYCAADGTCSCRTDCKGKECGDDGCGGSCGRCKSGERCERGRCRTVCQRDCRSKECGGDGCGGTCGQCAAGTTCRHGRCESDKAETAARLVSTARSEMRKGRYEKALDRLNEAAAVDGESLEIKNLRSDCYVGIKAREVKKLLAKARAALSRKDFDSCLDAAAKAGRLDPGNGEAAKLRKECKEKKDLEGMKF